MTARETGSNPASFPLVFEKFPDSPGVIGIRVLCHDLQPGQAHAKSDLMVLRSGAFVEASLVPAFSR